LNQLATPTAGLTERFQETFPTSARLCSRGKRLFPNGVTHDLRYLEPFPIYVDRAAGSHKWDLDGHELIDYWSGHGALLLGHSHPAVVDAVQKQMARGTHPGACHELELEWGEWVQRLAPSAERMRFVGSGTEATLMALRLARMYTGRPKLLKFAGHFHGWHDFVIPGADPPFDQLEVPGIPNAIVKQTVVVPPNIEAVERALSSDRDIGCVILEPTGGHFGVAPIGGEFLRQLRGVTGRHNVLLIFDEVITGFRIHPGGAQGYYGVTPDLTTLAKVLAGGLPGGCVAGRKDVLDLLEFRPSKPKMKHPGTFNANPLSAAAGIATLKLVAEGGPCNRANEAARRLRRQLNDLFARRGWNWIAYGEFSRVNLLPDYDGPRPARDDFIPYGGDYQKLYAPEAKRLVHPFRCAMLLNGVDMMGLRGMTMAAHTDADTERTVEAVAAAMDLLAAEGLL
jgi:glutamate-1-semialdehyde 2,1-aminomutase